MIDMIKAELATKIHYSYKNKEKNFRELPQYLIEETENILQWIKENTSEEARAIIAAVENDDDDLFKKLINPPQSLEDIKSPEELLTQIVLEDSIGPELFLLLLLTRRDIKQFILSLVGDLNNTKVVPLVITLLTLLQKYEEASEFVKDF